MTDIVERLRQHAYPGDTALTDEAADEIERLRKALREVQAKSTENRMDVSKDAVLHHVYEIAREALRHD